MKANAKAKVKAKARPKTKATAKPKMKPKLATKTVSKLVLQNPTVSIVCIFDNNPTDYTYAQAQSWVANQGPGYKLGSADQLHTIRGANNSAIVAAYPSGSGLLVWSSTPSTAIAGDIVCIAMGDDDPDVSKDPATSLKMAAFGIKYIAS